MLRLGSIVAASFVAISIWQSQLWVTIDGENAAIAKAYFASRVEMVDRADLIALVHFDAVKKVEKKSPHWTYREEASGTIRKIYKASANHQDMKVNSQIAVYGGETFICAQTKLSSGDCLVFLQHQDGFWQGANWHYSVLPVNGNQVKWLKSPHSREFAEATLAEAARDIKTDIASKHILGNLPPFLAKLNAANQLADEHTGEAPRPQEEYLAYEQALANASKYKKELETIARYGTPSGQLYAASALWSIDKKLAKQLFAAMESSRANVFYISGCKGSNSPQGEIAQSLASSGKYLNFKLTSK
ncbi:MAG TPA: hypothetical protein V6D17_12945 [Candidatus Obscuribacterales bacterium]